MFEGHGKLKNVVSMLRNEYAVGENSEKEWVELMERVKKVGIWIGEWDMRKIVVFLTSLDGLVTTHFSSIIVLSR